MKPALYVIACVATTALFLACTSPQQASAAQDLAETVTAATKDGIVTQAEADTIKAKMKAYTEAPGTDWTAVLGASLGSVVAGIFGLRYLPNSVIIGKQEAAHLDNAVQKASA